MVQHILPCTNGTHYFQVFNYHCPLFVWSLKKNCLQRNPIVPECSSSTSAIHFISLCYFRRPDAVSMLFNRCNGQLPQACSSSQQQTALSYSHCTLVCCNIQSAVTRLGLVVSLYTSVYPPKRLLSMCKSAKLATFVMKNCCESLWQSSPTAPCPEG